MSRRRLSYLLAAAGVVLLVIGGAAAFIAPIEVCGSYLFVEGGRFHYDGFGFGSFMFANIACQVLFYCLVAALAGDRLLIGDRVTTQHGRDAPLGTDRRPFDFAQGRLWEPSLVLTAKALRVLCAPSRESCSSNPSI
ncbi:MAG: hypothetical protein ACUVX9_10435 [Anaerolineae bacterium]